MVEITYYKNGVLETSRSFWGEWLADVKDVKNGKVQSREKMQSEPDNKQMNSEGQSISLDRSTLVASYSFTNVSKMTTDYTLTIQLATKRFSEQFDSIGRTETIGRCVSFKSVAGK